MKERGKPSRRVRSQSPALVAQEHAAWVISAELARAITRAAAAVAVPAGKGRRAGRPAPPGDLLHRGPPRHHHRHPLRRRHRQPARRPDQGQPPSRAGRLGPPPHHHRPRPAPGPENQGPSGLPACRAAHPHPHRTSPDQRLRPGRRLTPRPLPPRSPPSLQDPPAVEPAAHPERHPGTARCPHSPSTIP